MLGCDVLDGDIAARGCRRYHVGTRLYLVRDDGICRAVHFADAADLADRFDEVRLVGDQIDVFAVIVVALEADIGQDSVCFGAVKFRSDNAVDGIVACLVGRGNDLPSL